MNNTQLAHIWAQQTKASGNGSHMFFEGKSIYSYGHHYEIARFIDSQTVLFNANKSSVTTEGKHKNKVRRAIPEYVNVFVVPSVGGDHKKNVQYYKDEISALIERARKARTDGKYYLQRADKLLTELNLYADKFKLSASKIGNWASTVFPSDAERKAIFDKTEAYVKKREEKEAQREAEREAKAQENLSKWLNGENVSISAIRKIYLRKKDESTLQTSWGAEIPLTEALKLAHALENGEDVRGREIGDFTIRSFDGQNLVAGCHTISIDEIERFKATMNW